jgi:hypothetical protein
VYTSCVLRGALRFFNQFFLLIKKKKKKKIEQCFLYVQTRNIFNKSLQIKQFEKLLPYALRLMLTS